MAAEHGRCIACVFSQFLFVVCLFCAESWGRAVQVFLLLSVLCLLLVQMSGVGIEQYSDRRTVCLVRAFNVEIIHCVGGEYDFD